ncbi:myosin-binding protein 2-like isoform X1 [Zingiber officinale]|uniref:GTD-binding domain-containing protein n=2 Tax=Zingiber officinale TaxID=94328 RepID=A0A8J5KD74_ZINOF|nr:myosin-binding protein 2-like isoform X1 [Zingiber officinale]KAG6485297.1 hypothetical protein ZIOFF_053831 [Zingiber officinale]
MNFRFPVMAEAEVVDLREALRTQSAALWKLFAELEEERQAAASGAEEALSMIVRLQEEKAAAKMEACQYRRIAEEKLRHADESLLILREVILQKEMEIAALRFLVQDYRHMVGGAGWINNIDRMRTEHQQWFMGGGARTLLRKGSLARNISLPATQLEELSSELHIRDQFCGLLIDEQSSIRESDATRSMNAELNRPETVDANRRRPAIDPVKLVHFGNWDHVQENQNCSHLHEARLQEFRLANNLHEDQREKKSFGNSGDGSSTSQTDVEQLKKQMQKLEKDMTEMRHGNVDKGRELMHVLGRLTEQLDDIKTQVTKADANSECHREDDYCALTCLQEAMLSFWI